MMNNDKQVPRLSLCVFFAVGSSPLLHHRHPECVFVCFELFHMISFIRLYTESSNNNSFPLLSFFFYSVKITISHLNLVLAYHNY